MNERGKPRLPLARRSLAGPRGALIVVWVTLLGVSAQVGLSAQAQDEPFKKGIDARGDQKWADVVKYMQDAIRIDPNESARKVGSRLGLGGSEYMPHFHLGEAFFNLEQCASALAAWEESERQGVVRRSDRNAGLLRKGSAACESQGFLPLARLAAETQRVGAAIKEAMAAEQELAAIRAAHPDTSAPEYRSHAERGRDDLASARATLESARRSRRAPEMVEAAKLADNARRAYVSARAGLETAVKGLSELGDKVADVGRTIDEADRTAQAVAALIGSSPVRLSVSAALIEARRKAGDSLGSAKEKLAVARKTRSESDVAEARSFALDAQSAFSRVHADVERLRKTAFDGEIRGLRATAGDAFAAVEARVTQMRALLAGRSTAADVAARIENQLEAARSSLVRVRKRFEQAANTGDVVAARAAAGAASGVNAQLDAIAPLVGDPAPAFAIPDVLRRGAQLFFEGRYREALDSLSAEAAAPLPAELRAHAHVLRAASWFALYEYSGGKDESLRAAAREETDACKRLDPAFRPDPAAFAPKFLAFFVGGPASPR